MNGSWQSPGYPTRVVPLQSRYVTTRVYQLEREVKKTSQNALLSRFTGDMFGKREALEVLCQNVLPSLIGPGYARPSAAQVAGVSGIVRESGSGTPVGGAQIRVVDRRLRATTNAEGQAYLDVFNVYNRTNLRGYGYGVDGTNGVLTHRG